jgi:hypothetical protein
MIGDKDEESPLVARYFLLENYSFFSFLRKNRFVVEEEDV